MYQYYFVKIVRSMIKYTYYVYYFYTFTFFICYEPMTNERYECYEIL